MFVSRRDRSVTGDRSMSESFSKNRAGKAVSKSKKSFKDHSFSKRPADLDLSSSKVQPAPSKGPDASALKSAVVTISVGTPARLFAGHYDVLNLSPFFQSYLRSQYYNSDSRQLRLPEEVPEIFSCVLEFLYKGEYTPRIVYDQKRGNWALEATATSPGQNESTVWIPTAAPPSPIPGTPQPSSSLGAHILKDTAIYCAAERYGLPNLKRLALRKQGLQSGIPVATILASARYAYANTPDNDSKLRAHYLALIIRSRNTFKKSGTMQVEMGMGAVVPGSPTGTGLWFDLFVAMCNHLDDMEQIVKSPR